MICVACANLTEHAIFLRHHLSAIESTLSGGVIKLASASCKPLLPKFLSILNSIYNSCEGLFL